MVGSSLLTTLPPSSLESVRGDTWFSVDRQKAWGQLCAFMLWILAKIKLWPAWICIFPTAAWWWAEWLTEGGEQKTMTMGRGEPAGVNAARTYSSLERPWWSERWPPAKCLLLPLSAGGTQEEPFNKKWRGTLRVFKNALQRVHTADRGVAQLVAVLIRHSDAVENLPGKHKYKMK